MLSFGFPNLLKVNTTNIMFQKLIQVTLSVQQAAK